MEGPIKLARKLRQATLDRKRLGYPDKVPPEDTALERKLTGMIKTTRRDLLIEAGLFAVAVAGTAVGYRYHGRTKIREFTAAEEKYFRELSAKLESVGIEKPEAERVARAAVLFPETRALFTTVYLYAKTLLDVYPGKKLTEFFLKRGRAVLPEAGTFASRSVFEILMSSGKPVRLRPPKEIGAFGIDLLETLAKEAHLEIEEWHIQNGVAYYNPHSNTAYLPSCFSLKFGDRHGLGLIALADAYDSIAIANPQDKTFNPGDPMSAELYYIYDKIDPTNKLVRPADSLMRKIVRKEAAFASEEEIIDAIRAIVTSDTVLMGNIVKDVEDDDPVEIRKRVNGWIYLTVRQICGFKNDDQEWIPVRKLLNAIAKEPHKYIK